MKIVLPPGGSGPVAPFWTTIVKSANQDVTDAGVTDDTELQFATAPGVLYMVEAFLVVSGNNATGDAAIRLALSGDDMDGRGQMLSIATNNAIQTTALAAAAAAATNTVSIGTAADQGFPIATRTFFAFRQNTGAQIFSVQFGNNSPSGGRTTRMMAGSWLQYKVIG